MTRWLPTTAMLTSLSMGCVPDPKPPGDRADEGAPGATDWDLYDGDTGPDDLPATEPGDTGTAPVEATDPWGRDLSCPQPTQCISLAEAMDRNFAAVTLNGDLQVENHGPYPICSGRWHTFFSDDSQDSIAGHPDASWPEEPPDAFEIAAGSQWNHAYARASGAPAWWCIERTQVTVPGASYRFTGARAPEPLMSFVQSETDTNGNGIEDHSDFADPTTGAPWTNHNIWDHLAAQPTYVVGRTPNYLELQPGTSAPLTIEVVNLGRDESTLQVSETLPAGTRGYDFSVRPSSSESHSDGSTTHTWYFKMAGANDDDDLSVPATYDTVQIDLKVAWERPDCGYREVGAAPEVTWTDNAGLTHTSYGTELVLVCCDGT